MIMYCSPLYVTPCEGVGVEILEQFIVRHPVQVTPCEGVGVEICMIASLYGPITSRLARAWE